MNPDNQAAPSGMQINSPEFGEGQTIPAKYTCRGQNISPPLNIYNVPAEAQSLALIMHDPDAVIGDFTHWILWDIPASTQTIGASSVPVGAVQGLNGKDDIGYMGPCPPGGTGVHRYMFEVYALNRTINLESGSNRAQLTQAMDGKILSSATLTGIFAAEH